MNVVCNKYGLLRVVCFEWTPLKLIIAMQLSLVQLLQKYIYMNKTVKTNNISVIMNQNCAHSNMFYNYYVHS